LEKSSSVGILQKTGFSFRHYLDKISKLDLQNIAQKIGAKWTEKSATIPLFGKPHRISKRGIFDPYGEEPSHSIKVVLCQYLLLHPASHPEDDTWVSYKDFKDAAPLVTFHANNEMAIASTFEGKLKALKKACSGIGGYDYPVEMSYDLHVIFKALPKVPMLLLFNDSDDEFPAQCLLLFERRAGQYLDRECLAILGGLLTGYLPAWRPVNGLSGKR